MSKARERAEQLTLRELREMLLARRASMRLERFGRGNGHKGTLLVDGELYVRANGPTAPEALLELLAKAFERAEAELAARAS